VHLEILAADFFVIRTRLSLERPYCLADAMEKMERAIAELDNGSKFDVRSSKVEVEV
jgi:hypothetical protein